MKPCKCKTPLYENSDMCLSCGGYRYIQTDDEVLQAMWDEIDGKADTYARDKTGYILDGNELGAENNPKKQRYDTIKRHCKAFATPYGERLVEAEKLIEKMKGALEIVQKWQLPPTGRYWDFEETRPLSYEAAYGTNGSRDFMKNVANKAIAVYQTYIKTKEDGE